MIKKRKVWPSGAFEISLLSSLTSVESGRVGEAVGVLYHIISVNKSTAYY